MPEFKSDAEKQAWLEKMKEHDERVEARAGAAAASEGKRLHESDPSYELQKAREAAEAAAAEATEAIESKAPGWKKAKAKAAAKAKTAARVERKEAGHAPGASLEKRAVYLEAKEDADA